MLHKTLMVAAAITAASLCLPAFSATPARGTIGDATFPAKDRAWLKNGDFVNVDNLRRIMPGLGKTQVRLLLGNPHFNEGIAAVSRWNYIFNFPTGEGDAYITCQYQVVFVKNPDYRVESIHWDGPACLDLINKPEQAAATPTAAAERYIDVSADALFDFAKYEISDIRPQGREQLASIAAQLKGIPDTSFMVIGHTDRIGSDADNLLLSERRAQTIKRYLTDAGVTAPIITEGRGEGEPLVTCDQMIHVALVGCLSPNRRVSIRVNSLPRE